MSGTPTVIYHAASPQQAHILKSVLEDRGIAAWVVNESIQIAGGELPLGWTAAACVAVGDMDAEEARAIAVEFDQGPAHAPAAEQTADEPPAGVWKDWPACPQCGTLRQVRCGVCGSSGTDFPLADISDSGGQPRVLLVCRSCDDHFRPEMFRLCHRCGYDFGEGIEIGAPRRHSGYSPRLWVVIGGLVAGGLALAAYFYALTR